MEGDIEQILKCPRCGSTQTTYRVKTDDRICYKCGWVYKQEEIKK